MIKTKILLVEDDELAAELITEFLEAREFSVTSVFTATDCVSRVKYGDYDILLLDINLPDFNGYEVLKSVNTKVTIPVIITSAYSDIRSKLLAFKYGANDYMVKPIDLEELEARIWLQLSKNSKIQVNEEKRVFQIKGDEIYFKQSLLDLTTIEFDILSQLIQNQNQVMRRERLLETLSSLSSNRSLDNHIKNIRKKIDDDGNRATLLKTEYGVGYKLLS